MADSLFISAIILAAGKGLRFGTGPGLQAKQFWPLGEGTVLSTAVVPFAESANVDEIVVVLPQDAPDAALDTGVLGLPSTVKLVRGGPRRVDSSRLGLAAASSLANLIVIHDAARPLVRSDDLASLLLAAYRHGAALLAVPVNDTLKRADEELFVSRTIDRSVLWRAQTPQGFRREVLERAFAQAGDKDFTDEASMAEALGQKVKLVEGSPDNLKITTQRDLEVARALTQARGQRTETRVADRSEDFRLGQGWDFHRFDPERPLWLGCLHFADQSGLAGHSDADVLAHALIDALLGAAGLGDIGEHFPPGDPRWAGASGADLLAKTMTLFGETGLKLVNADLTLIGERPRIAPYRRDMASAMSAAVGVAPNLINVKGKTTESMGAIGRGEGLAASAAVLAAFWI
jgi:2-C-methyl-D-erythritol 4-phosphate cytidylyltransferase/2-C-methyl-D-erythritol 2,4-cyclodiphosphate synthase